jgi:hypothetical protein
MSSCLRDSARNGTFLSNSYAVRIVEDCTSPSPPNRRVRRNRHSLMGSPGAGNLQSNTTSLVSLRLMKRHEMMGCWNVDCWAVHDWKSSLLGNHSSSSSSKPTLRPRAASTPAL